MRRFFVPLELNAGQTVDLEPALSHRLRRVLRLKSGDGVILVDCSGREHEAVLESTDGSRASARIFGERRGLPEPCVEIVLYQSLIKGDRFEWVLEKGTELGVAKFVPLVVHRGVVRPQSGRRERAERWQRVVTEAAEQCGRSVLPQVAPPAELAHALASAEGLRLLPWEEERMVGLRSALREGLAEQDGAERPQLSIFVGPEGGFTRQEVEEALSYGARAVSLGRRILRSETAGIAAVAAVLYECGELGA
jgi:16S rRNA (uracil1498-N3)-methyltransferase